MGNLEDIAMVALGGVAGYSYLDISRANKIYSNADNMIFTAIMDKQHDLSRPLQHPSTWAIGFLSYKAKIHCESHKSAGKCLTTD
ncbi:MAG: hypothetical protein AABX05_01520 [Nanoarchaeota archaeon]